MFESTKVVTQKNLKPPPKKPDNIVSNMSYSGPQ